jgi:hypothetical protein
MVEASQEENVDTQRDRRATRTSFSMPLGDTSSRKQPEIDNTCSGQDYDPPGNYHLCYPALSGSPSCDSSMQVRHKYAEPPNFRRFQMQLACLLLTTALSVGSALDARNECVSVEELSWMKYAYSEDVSDVDDIVVQDERIECLNMFRFVMLPVGVVTVVFGLLSLFVINKHLGDLESFKDGTMPSPLLPLVQILPLLLIILLGWTYGIFSIMLRPKVDSVAGYAENPFKSLAAVDQMGYIGDNANLYYLSWMSQIISMALVFRVCAECFRWWRKGFNPQPLHSSTNTSGSRHPQGPVHEIISYTSAKRLASLYRERRKTWYQFMLRLRERSVFWVAAFFSSVVILASSSFLYFDLLLSLAHEMSNEEFQYRDICNIVKGSEEIPDEFCVRTWVSLVCGAIASFLCLISMILHLLVRRKAAAADEEQSHISGATQILPAMDPQASFVQLKLELFLSMCLCALLGINAIFATGVQGPASTVGNLYYASWIAFLLCLRVCLGCLEEAYIDSQAVTKTEKHALTEDSSQDASFSSEISINLGNYKRVAKKARPARLRMYFFLTIFSTICAASALDAASNQEQACSPRQLYLIFAPSGVALLSVVLFILCLRPRSYMAVSHICCGGLLSVICFLIWLVHLVITMHSDDSWAVNGIGELKLANLYYFSWASIVTAGFQMFSYLKPLFGGKEKDAMFVVWATLCKVCAIIFGAAFHVWHNIEGACSEAGDDSLRGMTFCSRTIFAFIAAGTGIVSGWSVLGTRLLGCPISSQTRARGEAILALFLVFFFGVAVALITSIGGPGQSVGDLYYATWLAFWVCIGIFVSCYDEMKQEEIDVEIQRYQEECASDYIDLGSSGGIHNGRFA